jgi:uncharacterized protein (DUF983 family)
VILPEKAPVPSRCPRCSGPLYRGYDDDYSCLFCGEHIYTRVPQPVIAPLVPPGPRKRGRPRKNPVAA